MKPVGLKRIDVKGASGMIKFFAGSCLSGLEIVVKKPSSIRGLDERIVVNRLPLSKDKTGFFITSPYPRVLSAFGVIFQKKFNHT
jgi:hypothetical protein